MQRCVAGDRQAFTALYSYYAPLLYKVIYPLTNRSREDTEEIIQELFVKIWEKRDRMLTIRSFRPFIFRLARNRVIDWYRKREIVNDYRVFYSAHGPRESDRLEDHLLFEEYYSLAMEAIAKLPPRQREIFHLRHTSDLSLAEVADTLHISINGVKKQLYEATRFVRDYLQRHGEWTLLLLAYFFCF